MQHHWHDHIIYPWITNRPPASLGQKSVFDKYPWTAHHLNLSTYSGIRCPEVTSLPHTRRLSLHITHLFRMS